MVSKASFLEKYSNIQFFGISMGVLFLFRLLSFHSDVYNPDEIEWIYGIERVWIDSKPFVGFEAHTSGPLSIYILSLLKLFITTPSTLHLRLFSFLFFIIPTLAIVFWTRKNYLNFGGLYFLLYLLAIPSEDFYSYNTEYQIMLFTAILYQLLSSELNLWRLIAFTTVLVLFIFIKIQVAFLFVFFALAMAFKLISLKNFPLFRIYIALGISLMGFILVCLWGLGSLNEANYTYIEQNLLYSTGIISWNSWGLIFWDFLKFEYHNFLIPVLVLISFLGVLLFKWRKSNQGNFKVLLRSRLVLSFLLFLTSLITIIFSKFNFGHYFIISFFPLACLFSEVFFLMVKNATKWLSGFMYVPLFLLSLLIFLNFRNVYSLPRLLTLSPHVVLLNSAEHVKNHPLDIPMKDWLLKNYSAKDPTILTLGWFNSQLLYYHVKHAYKPISRSSNTFWLGTTYQDKNHYFFNHEEANLMEDIAHKPPHFIVDCEGLLEKIKGTRLERYVKLNYRLVNSSHQYKIFQRLN